MSSITIIKIIIITIIIIIIIIHLFALMLVYIELRVYLLYYISHDAVEAHCCVNI